MSPIRKLLLILALTAMWSPSFLFIKLAIAEIPPLTTIALRVTLAALIFIVILFFKRRSLPRDPLFWIHSSMMALFSSIFPFYMFCYAEQSIDSSLAAILNGTTPMFTAFLAHYFIPSDQFKLQKFVGIGLSFCGLSLLFLPKIIHYLSGSSAENFGGILACTTGAFSYAVSHIYAKKFLIKQPSFVAPTAQILISSLILIPLALWIEAPYDLPLPSFSAISGVCGLALIGTVFAFMIYYRLLEHCGPTAISMVACFFPAVGMFLGFLFLGESLAIKNLVAAGLILLGVAIVNELIVLKKKEKIVI